MTLAFLGDVVGAPGRLAVQQHIATLRREYTPDAVIANGENIRNGSGITPDLYRSLRDAGVDAVTLGDHCFLVDAATLTWPGTHLARALAELPALLHIPSA